MNTVAPLRWLFLCLQFATIIPSPPVKNATEHDMRRSVLYFPVVGFVLGGAMWFVQANLCRYMSPLPASVVVLTMYTILTGVLHLDGLMDTADAIGSRKPREQALEVMKDSRVGAMGVVIAVIAIVGKLSTISSLTPHEGAPFLVVPMVSRLGMLWSMWIAPSARQSGLGALFAKKVPLWTVVIATLFVIAVCVGMLSLRTLFVVVIYFIAITLGFTFWMVRRFGGTTGDTYGALNEILEWAGWMIFVVMS